MGDMKLMPQAQEAEKSLLGTLLNNSSLYDSIANYLSDDAFYDSKNRRIFKLIKSMKSSREDVNFATVCAKLNSKDKSMGVTSYYISGLIQDAGMDSTIESVSRTLYEKRLLRKIINDSHQINSLAYNNNSDVYNIMNETQNTIARLMDLRPNQTFNIDQALDDTVNNIADGHKNIIKTGFTGIDELAGGMTKGEITILGGRPGHGKTTTMINMIKSCIEQGLKVMVFNREMTNVEMLKKLIVLESDKLSYLNVRQGLIGDLETMAEIEAVKRKLSDKYAEDKFAMFDNISNFDECSVQVKKFKPDVIFDDYIQLIDANSHIKERRLQLEKLVNDYKWLVKTENCAAVLVSQLNRALEARGDAKPRMSDLAESGAIEQVAENVLFVFYQYKTDINKYSDGQNIIELIGSKVRYGTSGSTKLGFNGDKVKLYNSIEELRRELVK
jgi:replicative DNA helicase